MLETIAHINAMYKDAIAETVGTLLCPFLRECY